MTLKLKVEGDKLTGNISAPGRDGQATDTEIQNGKITGSNFPLPPHAGPTGNKVTSKYRGKVSGDTIKGKMEFERNGEPVSRDWEAKRGGDTK